MQHFLNHQALERAAAEVFSGASARTYLIIVLTIATAAAAGWGLAAIWLGLVVLVEISCKRLSPRIAALAPANAHAAGLTLNIVESAALSGAPAIAWYAEPALWPMTAIAMLGALLVVAALQTRDTTRLTLIKCVPYALLGLAILIDATAAGVFWMAAASLCLCLYAFAAALHHARAARHARRLDLEWVRQFNMSNPAPSIAAWEIDFPGGRIVGAEKLSALVGSAVSFEDLATGLFAPPEERALVCEALSPGASRQVILEHHVMAGDASRKRIRHQGFLRTAPNGSLERFTCISSVSVSEVVSVPMDGPLGAGPLVVVINDDADARDLTARTLVRAGFSVQGAGRADANLILARERMPALIVLGVSRPDGSDLQVVKSLKQASRTRDIPVVVLSNHDDRVQALSLGAAEHLVHPVDRDVLTATAMRLARLQPAPRAAASATPAKIKNAG